jgi:hypothetical protein
MYIKSIPAIGIKQNHLRMPADWDSLKEEYETADGELQRRTIRKKMLALEDVPPGKSGIVRDIELRDRIRDWLKENKFADMDKAKPYLKEHGLIINGTPVRKVRLLWKLNEVKEVRRKGFDYENSSPQAKRKSLRVYQTQNNHHIEIREKASEKGEVKWSGDVVTNFDAAERIRRNNEPIIDKSESEKGKFVMSLSKGEIVHMRYSETQEANYFVVFKIDKAIHFTPHTDANPASSRKKDVKLREEIPLVPNDLRKAIVFTEGGVPEKVKISPLGEVEVLVND